MNHFFQSIDGWSAFREFYIDAVNEAPQEGAYFVEVGSWMGRSAAFMAVEIINSGKDIRFDCVDHWRGSVEHGQVNADALYRAFLANTAPVRHVVNPVCHTSLDAARLYEDESLDFVLIDASHEHKDVLADIQAWLPKVKPGCVLAGDDYYWDGVRRACDEVFGGYVGAGPLRANGEQHCWRIRK